MAFTVQNDAGDVAGANAYCGVAYFREYFSDIGTDTSTYLDTAVEQAIVAGTRYLDQRYRYPGEKKNRNQSTMWPRWDVEDESGDIVDVVPVPIKQATCEAAIRKLSGVALMPDPTYDASGQQISAKSVTVGPITESYTYSQVVGAPKGLMLPQFPSIQLLLTSSGLLASGVSREIVRG